MIYFRHMVKYFLVWNYTNVEPDTTFLHALETPQASSQEQRWPVAI